MSHAAHGTTIPMTQEDIDAHLGVALDLLRPLLRGLDPKIGEKDDAGCKMLRGLFQQVNDLVTCARRGVQELRVEVPDLSPTPLQVHPADVEDARRRAEGRP